MPRKVNTKDFVEMAISKHGYKYDYSKSIYTKRRDKIIITCREHGDFEQVTGDHLQGAGCPKCKRNKPSILMEEFLKRAKTKHGDKYDYSLVDYRTSKSKIKIICSKHGIFEQKMINHYRGQGCPQCRESIGERTVERILSECGINYVKQKTFNKCTNKRKLKFDFYLPEHNTCIEFDGRQHFEPVEAFGGEKEFIEIKTRDKIKTMYCKNEGINLLRISYKENIKMILEKLND